MRLFAFTVGKNEESRYLSSMIRNLDGFVDDHFFYDDQSTDRTLDIADVLGCVAIRRPDGVASFSEDEGMFREAAWKSFELHMHPRLGDWVLVIDCDEFLSIKGQGVEFNDIMRGGTAVNLSIPEVFGFDTDGCPLVRTDRKWGTIFAPRLFAYQENGGFARGKVGVPAVPSYVMATPNRVSTDDVVLMHLGYARFEDQEIKYARYNGVDGHSDEHVQSIVSPDKTLVRCEEWKCRIPWKQLMS
jgi:hypothetical protein